MGKFENALLFKAIIEQGSLAKAAERLAIPTSTANKRLHQLETDLGIQLLKRSTRQQ